MTAIELDETRRDRRLDQCRRSGPDRSGHVQSAVYLTRVLLPPARPHRRRPLGALVLLTINHR